MPAGPLAFVELPRQLAQYSAELSGRLARGGVFYSLRPEVRSILSRGGATVGPEHTRLRAESDRRDIDLTQYKHADHDPSDLRRQVARLRPSLTRFLDSTRAGAVFVWNGSGLTAAVAVALARERGLPVLFGENGYLPGTLQLDPQGVNALSSAFGLVRAGRYRGFSLDADGQQALDRSLSALRLGRRLPTTPPARTTSPSWSARLRREVSRPIDPARWTLPGRERRLAPSVLPDDVGDYVLLPLQVLGDSQLLQHSPLVGNRLAELVETVSTALQRVSPQLKLLIKLHPAERADRLCLYRAVQRRCRNTVWVRGLPVSGLIQRAKAVVTVNSTVGFEALALDRPVLTLGSNFYCHDPLVITVPSLERLEERLTVCLSTEPPQTARREFIAWTWRHLLVPAGYRDFGDASLNAMSGRIEQLLRD